MNTQLLSNHLTFQLKDRIAAICNEFLVAHDLNYFQYCRILDDGSITLLTNNTDLFEYFVKTDNEQVAYSSYDDTLDNYPDYWFLWEETLPSNAVNIAKHRFNLHNGLTLLRRRKRYYDMIAIAGNQHINKAASFYLNKQKAIEAFINTFDLEQRELIKLVNQHPIILSPNQLDKNYNKLCFANKRISVLGVNGQTYITIQEFACIKLLASGASYKQIALALDISPRTVESYIARITLRTGITKLSRLERLIYS
jgi:DNA-binding CsgD family transcriptional regulator